MITKRLLLSLSFLICHLSFSVASDYVDQINSSTEKRAEGRRVVYEMSVGIEDRKSVV